MPGTIHPMTAAQDFDHTRCPSCGTTMRLTGTRPHFFGGYERHSYACRGCGNESRFVFELPPSSIGDLAFA